MKFEYLKTRAEVDALITLHNESPRHIALDTETTGLDPFKDTITHIIISGKGRDSACMFDAEHAEALLDLSTAHYLMLQNFKFDFRMLRQRGINLDNYRFLDAMLLHHLLDENAEHSLDSMVKTYYNDPYKTLFWEKYKKFEEAPEAEQLEYACKDVIYTGWLCNDFYNYLKDEGVPEGLIYRTHQLAFRLYQAECHGVLIDQDYLIKVGAELKEKITRMRLEMREHARPQVERVEVRMWNREMSKRKTPRGKAKVPKPQFSFDSPKQLCELFYDVLRFPPVFSKTKNRTADDAALEQLMHLHPVVGVVQEYRGYQKNYTAYIEGTLERMQDGRIYPSFNINGTVTGRISSSNPNMQQLPKAGGIRGIYIPDPGHKFVTCDYAQLEVTVAAHFSRDKLLLKIVHEGASLHDLTAEALKVPRDIAKTVNFAMQYLCTPYRVAKILSCSMKEAEHVWNKYWEAYSGLKAFIDECDALVEKGLPIVNPFGRKRRFPTEFNSPKERAAARRQAFSSLVQGTGADMTHAAFIDVANKMLKYELGRAMFEVHDEILNMPKDSACEQAKEVLQSSMLDVGKEIKLSVPLRVDCSEPLDRWEK